MSVLTLLCIGFIAGMHGALYGAYKDSPHECFILRRFIREPAIALSVVAVLALYPATYEQSHFTVYLSVFALARLATEFWKLFVRIEPQQEYRIPTQIHLLSKVVHNPFVRVLLGAGMMASVFGWYKLMALLPDSIPWPVTGVIVAGGIGIMEAIGGGYKDGTIEGFSFFKFLKSPVFGAVSGLIVSFHTTSLAFLLLASLGSMRMFLELFFKMIVRDYTPGKFKSMEGPYQAWMRRRKIFLPPYALTWMLYVAFFSGLA